MLGILGWVADERSLVFDKAQEFVWNRINAYKMMWKYSEIEND